MLLRLRSQGQEVLYAKASPSRSIQRLTQAAVIHGRSGAQVKAWLLKQFKSIRCIQTGHVMRPGAVYIEGNTRQKIDGCYCFRCGKSWHYKKIL